MKYIGGSEDKQFLFPNQTKIFWKQIRDKLITNNDDYRLFITSDKSNVIDEASKEFSSEKVIGFKDRSFHISNKYMKLPPLNQNECKKVSELYLDFYVLGICDSGVLSHSGFGLCGILNRVNKRDLANFYVFTNLVEKSKNFWSLKNLTFQQFTPEILEIK